MHATVPTGLSRLVSRPGWQTQPQAPEPQQQIHVPQVNVRQLVENTHAYDGALKTRNDFVSKFSPTPRTTEEQVDAFAELQEKFAEHKVANEHGRRCLEVMCNTGRTSANYDPSNGLYVDDLLYEIYLLSKDPENEDLFDLLASQLEDMRTGFCPQGRTTRLFQVVDAFKKISQPKCDDTPSDTTEFKTPRSSEQPDDVAEKVGLQTTEVPHSVE